MFEVVCAPGCPPPNPATGLASPPCIDCTPPDAPPVIPPVTPTIVINTVTPSPVAGSQSVTFHITGVDLQAGDVFVFDGVEYPTTFIDAANLDAVGVPTGSIIRAANAYIKRGAAISNTLQVSVV